MNIFDAVILGLIQGLTEFIPVSSSGHLVLAAELSGIKSSFAFDVMLHIGTLAALVVYFRPRIVRIIQDMRDGRGDLARNLFFSALPVLVVGGLFVGWFESDALRNGWVVAFMLVSVGLVMVGLDRLRGLGGRDMNELSPASALAIGLGQALALIPGASRSGTTIIAARLMNLSYRDSAEYSFLLAIPVIAGAILRALFTPAAGGLWQDNTSIVLAGITASFLSGLWAIRFMLAWLDREGLKRFGYYRIALGLLVVLTMTI